MLLLASAGLLAIITWGGWDTLEGAKPLQIAYIVLYLLMAFFVLRWSRGVLPVASALAIIMLIFAAVSAPQWFDRDKAGFTNPTLDESLHRAADRADGPAADPPDRVRHERLPPGVERRGRAPPETTTGRAATATAATARSSAPSAATPPPPPPEPRRPDERHAGDRERDADDLQRAELLAEEERPRATATTAG